MQRARRLAPLASRLSSASASFHSRPNVVAGGALLQEPSATEGVLFPREGPGVNYALNWALARVGVTPGGEAFRNLRQTDLEASGAVLPGSKSGVAVYVKGHGPLSKGKFNRLFKEVTAYLSAAPKIYVHDGAVGSASKFDARTRVLADSPAGALALSSILAKTPTRELSSDLFPVTVYVASSYSSAILDKKDYIAFDPETSALLVVGSALGDVTALKSALMAAASPTIADAGGLPLPARLLVEKDMSVLLLAPKKIQVPTSPLLSKAAVTQDGTVWAPNGVARLFSAAATEPNLYAQPSALALLTSDSSGAIPPISQLSPGQAAYYFLAGFDGTGFTPACSSGLPSVAPSSVAEKLAEMLKATEVPAFLINVNEGGKVLSGKELEKLVAAAATKKLPKGAAEPAEAAVNALKAKFDGFMKAEFPDLPEGIAP